MVFRNRKIIGVDDIAAWQLCCGCGVCAYVCPDEIEMIDTLEYGRRPRSKENSSTDNSKLAMQVCPGIELTRLPKPVGQVGEKGYYDVWGPLLGVWEGHAADEKIRFEGSSGGVATALAAYAMEHFKMSGALHVRSRKDVSYLNRTVFSTMREELLEGAGSRYSPASPCDSLERIEDAGGPCVFIGKPCDVAAVGKAAELRPALREKIGLTIAFFCAGTPSIHGTLEMFKQMGIDDPASVTSLRYRGRGWPGLTTVEHSDKTGENQRKQLTYEQSWGEILQKYRQWRCYICPDHVGEFADIAVADAWHRSVSDNQPGISVMIARTIRGKEILEKGITDGFIEAEAVGPEVLLACRTGQAAYQGRLWARMRTLKFMNVPTPEYRGFDLFKLWRCELSIKDRVRSFLSTVKRVLVKKLYGKRTISAFINGSHGAI